jgi:hypothetical protein
VIQPTGVVYHIGEVDLFLLLEHRVLRLYTWLTSTLLRMQGPRNLADLGSEGPFSSSL